MVALTKNFPTVNDIVCVHNAGGPNPNGCARLGWDYFAEEIAPQYSHNLIHLLSHWTTPMQFCQWSYVRAAFKEHDIANSRQFVKSMQRFDGWWGVYVGGPTTLPKFDKETDAQWRSRATDELRPFIEARPTVMYFDMVKWSQHFQSFKERLENTYDIIVGGEPHIPESLTQWHDMPMTIQTEQILQREGPKSTSGWDTGKFAKDPLRNPRKHPHVIELVRSSYVKEDIAAARERGFVPGVNVGPLKGYLKELAK